MSEPRPCGECRDCYTNRASNLAECLSLCDEDDGGILDRDPAGQPLRHDDCPVQCREDRQTLAKALLWLLEHNVRILPPNGTRPTRVAVHMDTNNMDPCSVTHLAAAIGVDPERLRELLEVKPQ